MFHCIKNNLQERTYPMGLTHTGLQTFIYASWQMKHDFKKMEDEMDKLANNMSAITEFSDKISGTLQEKRQHITKLSGVHTLLKKV